MELARSGKDNLKQSGEGSPRAHGTPPNGRNHSSTGTPQGSPRTLATLNGKVGHAKGTPHEALPKTQGSFKGLKKKKKSVTVEDEKEDAASVRSDHSKLFSKAMDMSLLSNKSDARAPHKDDKDETGSMASSFKETEIDDTKKQLEELQMRTVWSLVEDIELESDGMVVNKKLLFVTNKQARMFDLSNIGRFMQAFEISPRPKLVINLFPSFASCVASAMYNIHWSNMTEKRGSHHWTCEMTEEDLYGTDRKIGMFLKKCILPVAIQTNALVVINNNSCALSKAFGELVKAEAVKNGGKLPFTVVSFCWAAKLPFGTE